MEVLTEERDRERERERERETERARERASERERERARERERERARERESERESERGRERAREREKERGSECLKKKIYLSLLRQKKANNSFVTCFRGGFRALPPAPACAPVFTLLPARGEEEEEGTIVAAAAASLSPPPPPPPLPSLPGGRDSERASAFPSLSLPLLFRLFRLRLIDRDIAISRASLASAGAGGPSLRKREERVTRTAPSPPPPPEEAAAAEKAVLPSPAVPAVGRTRDSLASRIVLFLLFLLPALSPPPPPASPGAPGERGASLPLFIRARGIEGEAKSAKADKRPFCLGEDEKKRKKKWKPGAERASFVFRFHLLFFSLSLVLSAIPRPPPYIFFLRSLCFHSNEKTIRFTVSSSLSLICRYNFTTTLSRPRSFFPSFLFFSLALSLAPRAFCHFDIVAPPLTRGQNHATSTPAIATLAPSASPPSGLVPSASQPQR